MPHCGTNSAVTPFRLRASSQKNMSPASQTREASLARNPLRQGLHLPPMPDPCALVIFGASGDLTRRKLFPAVYSLAVRNLLPERFAIVGVARTEESDTEFKNRMREAVEEFGRDPLDEKVWRRLTAGMHYLSTDFAAEGGEDELIALLTKLDAERGTAGNCVFYLAVPPSAIGVLVDRV